MLCVVWIDICCLSHAHCHHALAPGPYSGLGSGLNWPLQSLADFRVSHAQVKSLVKVAKAAKKQVNNPSADFANKQLKNGGKAIQQAKPAVKKAVNKVRCRCLHCGFYLQRGSLSQRLWRCATTSGTYDHVLMAIAASVYWLLTSSFRDAGQGGQPSEGLCPEGT